MEEEGELNGKTAIEGTKIVKLAKRPLGPQIFPGRNQAEKATHSAADTDISYRKGRNSKRLGPGAVGTVN